MHSVTLTVKAKSHFSHLLCSECTKEYPVNEVNTHASCVRCTGNILLSRYADAEENSTDLIEAEERSMWRYFPWLPVFDRKNIVTLGEGFTPVLNLQALATRCGLDQLLLKDESLNPTGSFKARGMSMAITKAKELGIRRCIVPTAGNAGGAMAAYCAKAGIEAVVVMPEHTPDVFKQECKMFGAQLVLVKGLINDCAKKAKQINQFGEYLDLSTFKEPYRLEGKKTMGFEIAEQLSWILPDVILYPTGGGTGLIGMWKAFHEMAEMKWVSGKFPRMIAVQAQNCQPLVETWLGNQVNATEYVGQSTIANGLAVPCPFAEKMILRVIKESQGLPIAVSETEIRDAAKEIAKAEGMILAPEGAALWAALKSLLATRQIARTEKILLLNTGSGYKYMENYSSGM